MMVPRTVLTAAVAAAAALVLAACGAESGPTPSPTASANPATDLDGRAFLGDMIVRGGESLPLAADTRLSLAFTGDRVTAHAGCNTMSGSATVTDATLVVGQLAQTEMACAPQIMDQEQWWAEFLMSRPEITLAGVSLTLTSGDTVVPMVDRVQADPDRPLTGTTWLLDSIVGGDSVSSIPAGVRSTLVFSDDGTVAVKAGCNTGGGAAQVDEENGTIEFGPLRLTKMMCPPEEMQVEAAVTAALVGRVPYSIEARTLSLESADGSGGLRYRATAPR